MKKSGIYRITNIENNKVYIGSSIDLTYRLKRHQNDLKRSRHCNDHLQKSWNKYGEDSFGFEIIELCDKAKIIEREQFYIDTLKPQYNICKIAGNTIGQNCEHFMTKEAIKEKRRKQSENISKALKGKDFGTDHAIKNGAKLFKVYKAKCIHFRTKGSPSIYEKTELVGSFLKRSDCSKSIGVHEKFIRRCLQGKRTQSHGYIFEREEIL